MKKNILIVLLFVLGVNMIYAQNKYEEVLKYEEIDGMIVFPAVVKGKTFKFVFDPTSLPLVSEEYVDDMDFLKNNMSMPYQWKDAESLSGGTLPKFTIGKTIFIEKLGALVVKSDYMKKHGIAGVVNARPFIGYVVTIDSKNKQLTVSTPYKPKYVSLRNRMSIDNKLQSVKMEIGEQELDVYLDFGGKKQELALSKADANRINVTSIPSNENGIITLPLAEFAKNKIENVQTIIADNDTVSSIGTDILKRGIISLDYLQSRAYFQLYENIDQELLKSIAVPVEVKEVVLPDNEIITLTRLNFTDLVFDYKQETEWKYKGDKPAIIDFWAEWCGPCKKISKSLEELVKEYGGQIRIFKLNVDDEPELAKYFEAQSLPLLLYIPMDGKPIAIPGAFGKEKLEENIKNILLKK